MHYQYYGRHAEPTAKFNRTSMTDEQLAKYLEKLKASNDKIIADI